jgi:hypothetical protein
MLRLRKDAAFIAEVPVAGAGLSGSWRPSDSSTSVPISAHTRSIGSPGSSSFLRPDDYAVTCRHACIDRELRHIAPRPGR